MKDDLDGYVDEISRITKNEAPIGTDIWFAKYFANSVRGKICYCKEFGWMVWNEKFWERGEESSLIPMIESTSYELMKSNNSTVREKAIKGFGHSLIKNCISLTKGYCSVSYKVFDDTERDMHLLNCQNGIFDVKNNKLLPHTPSQYMTRISNAEYDPKADCPNWINFLKDVFQKDYELISYIQKILGYLLTGSVGRQEIYVLYGRGQNGKNSFVNTIEKLLGVYSVKGNTDTLIAGKSSKDLEREFVNYQGKRLVWCSESEQGQRLKEGVIKNITGSEPLEARYLFKESFRYLPEFKIFFMTNHKPRVIGHDKGIWRRIKMIPFGYTIPEDKKISEYENKFLYPEINGIFRWAIEGFYESQKEFKEPKIVLEATREYKSDQNDLQAFIDECCQLGESLSVQSTSLKNKYEEYIGHKISRADFKQLMQAEGFEIKKNSTHFWQGIGIKSSSFNDNIFGRD